MPRSFTARLSSTTAADRRILDGNQRDRLELRAFLQILVENIIVPRSRIDACPLGIDDKPVRQPCGGIEHGKFQSGFRQIIEPMLGTHRFIENSFSANSGRVKIVSSGQQTSWNNRIGASPRFFEILDQLFCFLHDVTIRVDIAFRHRVLLRFSETSTARNSLFSDTAGR
jgi:hypothetical protein